MIRAFYHLVKSVQQSQKYLQLMRPTRQSFTRFDWLLLRSQMMKLKTQSLLPAMVLPSPHLPSYQAAMPLSAKELMLLLLVCSTRKSDLLLSALMYLLLV